MRVLITGAGTLGTELAIQLMQKNPKEQHGMNIYHALVTVMDNSENALWAFQEAMRKAVATGRLTRDQVKETEVILGDIKEKSAIDRVLRGGMQSPYIGEVDTVIHTAALKHVMFTNNAPYETIATNIQGTANVIQSCLEHNIPQFVFISSDKACHPSNIYGQSKKFGELLTSWAAEQTQYSHEDFRPYFSCRFGNFLGSSGSVIDRWKEQRPSGEILLTDPKMNRFFITPMEAAKFVIRGLDDGWDEGDVFVPVIPVINMETLATCVHNIWGDVTVKTVGAGQGEKTDELMIGIDEAPRAKVEDFGFRIGREFVGDIKEEMVTTASLPLMSREQTMAYIRSVI